MSEAEIGDACLSSSERTNEAQGIVCGTRCTECSCQAFFWLAAVNTSKARACGRSNTTAKAAVL